MTVRILGAGLILLGCGAFGFLLAATYRHNTLILKSFIESLDMLYNELKYRRSPLPLLCHYIAANQSGVLKVYYQNLEKELMRQIQPDAATCAVVALKQTAQLPGQVRDLILQLSRSLGKFDIEGQLLGVQAVKTDALRQLNLITSDQEQRLKNYRTLGVCAGAAIIILFI